MKHAAPLQGGLRDEEDRYTDDTCLIHLDIKPKSVLLASEERHSNDSCPPFEYPRVQLAAFGVAELTNIQDNGNPQQLLGIGTPGFKAPEQTQLGNDWRSTPPNPPRANNVWNPNASSQGCLAL